MAVRTTHLDLERIGLALLLLLLVGLLPALLDPGGPLRSLLKLLDKLLPRPAPARSGAGLLVLLRPLARGPPALPLREPDTGGGGLRSRRGGEGGSSTTVTTVPSIWPPSM